MVSSQCKGLKHKERAFYEGLWPYVKLENGALHGLLPWGLHLERVKIYRSRSIILIDSLNCLKSVCLFIPYKQVIFWRQRSRKRERERDQFVVPITYAFIG